MGPTMADHSSNSGDSGDDYQIEIPPSFFALYADPRRPYRLRESMALVRSRYEVCEDLATLLVDQARILSHVEVPSETEVMLRIYAGLLSEDSGVSHDEARWITTRLAELLDWRLPELGA